MERSHLTLEQGACFCLFVLMFQCPMTLTLKVCTVLIFKKKNYGDKLTEEEELRAF